METRSQAAPDKILAGYLQMTQALLEMSNSQLKENIGDPKTINLV